MPAREFDDVAALVDDWRAAAFPVRRPGCALDPFLRAQLHVGRAVDAWGKQLVSETETYLESH